MKAVEIYTPKEVAQLLRVGPNRVYEMCHQRLIPHVRLGRRILIPRRAFERWLDGELVRCELGLGDPAPGSAIANASGPSDAHRGTARRSPQMSEPSEPAAIHGRQAGSDSKEQDHIRHRPSARQ